MNGCVRLCRYRARTHKLWVGQNSLRGRISQWNVVTNERDRGRERATAIELRTKMLCVCVDGARVFNDGTELYCGSANKNTTHTRWRCRWCREYKHGLSLFISRFSFFFLLSLNTANPNFWNLQLNARTLFHFFFFFSFVESMFTENLLNLQTNWPQILHFV